MGLHKRDLGLKIDDLGFYKKVFKEVDLASIKLIWASIKLIWASKKWILTKKDDLGF